MSALFMMLSISLSMLLIMLCSGEKMTEEERIVYFKTHHTWPPTWHNETEGYKALQKAREIEIMQLTGARERWENWMQFIHGQLVPKFTPHGYKVVDMPNHLFQKLLDEVKIGLSHWDDLPEERGINGIYGPLPCKFVHLPSNMATDIMEELTAFHEEWIGGNVKLRPTSAYGVRLYQNGSSLMMHHDRIETHVISSISHIAHEYDDDSQPWPLQIEDHDGVLQSVNLQPGQTLFYESAKCLHGRLTEFRGRYYGSIFIHYAPVDWTYQAEDVVNAVPPHWREGAPIIDEVGSRWVGQGITIDSRAAAGAPPRIVDGVYVHDNKSPHSEL